MTEKQFLEQVKQLARLYGWRLYHTFDSRRSASGFPDLVLVRAERLVFAELKSDEGKTTPKQDEWLAALDVVAAHAARAAGFPAPIEVFVWRPSDFDDIARVLAR